MKLLSSSFSSSSSTSISSTTSFDSRSATASCLAGILRRILCSGTLPTYPSDHVTDEASSAASFRELKADEKTNPGLVARLMGLESMPETNFRTSISRSRSMNSADRFKEDEAKAGLHRRVKSSAALRNAPAFLELENDEFFILSFENVRESREFRSRGGKFETGYGESKQRRRVKGKRPENRAATPTKKEDQGVERKVLSDLNGRENSRRNSADRNRDCLVPKKIPCQKRNVVGSEAVKPWKPKDSDNVVNSNGVTVKPGLRTKKKKSNSQVVKPVKPEVDSEDKDSSPVSVLNCSQFLVDPAVSISEDNSTTSSTTSRRKLSLEDNSERQTPGSDDDLIVGEERKEEAKQGKYVGSKKKQSERRDNSDILDEIWRLSETELSGASWVQKWTFDHQDFQGIGEELEGIILSGLIQEFVDQF